MRSEDYVGSIGRTPLDVIVSSASHRIRHARTPRAVCVDPDGRVTVERYDHAVPGEVIGNFDRTLGWPELDKRIRDELLEVAQLKRRRAA